MNPIKKFRAELGSKQLQKAALSEMMSYRTQMEADAELLVLYNQNKPLYESAHLRNFVGNYVKDNFDYLSEGEKHEFGQELYRKIMAGAHSVAGDVEERTETGASYVRFIPAAVLATSIIIAANVSRSNTGAPDPEPANRIDPAEYAQTYAQGFAQERLEEPELHVINGEQIYISSVYKDGIAATLAENLPVMEKLLGDFPCDEYFVYTGDFGYLAQSGDCVSVIDKRAISEPMILHEGFNQYTKDINFPNELAWFKFGAAEYVARELTNSWNRFDRTYGTDYVTNVPASQINSETYGGEWSYYASRKGTDILRSINFGSTPKERVGNLGRIIKSLPENPTTYDVLDRLATYESRDVLEEKITGAR